VNGQNVRPVTPTPTVIGFSPAPQPLPVSSRPV
jgi:hypothetical protein